MWTAAEIRALILEEVQRGETYLAIEPVITSISEKCYLQFEKQASEITIQQGQTREAARKMELLHDEFQKSSAEVSKKMELLHEEFLKTSTEFAQKVAAELVVLSSQGQGFLEHLLVGSVAERVVRLATCPVLVLRA